MDACGTLLPRLQTFVKPRSSCDQKQRKGLADFQWWSDGDSSVAAGRIRRINRKKSVTLKASVCVLIGSCASRSLSTRADGLFLRPTVCHLHLGNSRGGGPFRWRHLERATKRYFSGVITALVWIHPSLPTFGGRRSRDSAPTWSCFYRSFAAKAQQCLNRIPAAEKMMDVRSHFFTVRLLLSPCMEKPSGTSFPHPVK